MVRTLMAATMTLLASSAWLHVESNDILAGHAVPKVFMARACGGENRSPSLAWSGAPRGTASFAIIMHDADAPIPGGFYHWVLYNLPSRTFRLEPNVKLAADQIGLTSAARAEYHGPCPPPGPAHHYIITVYALDLPRISATSPLRGAELERRIEGHVLARGVLEATASTSP
ncbi:MAG TPA: YbhB/YbcL family Raf kinase inhibitor-like protein [Candidatus Cybelea sp.]|nr:YbhB/YbcL family Raf kinase inhibitor-like protein [Candidatus Cybelea sp.]